MVDIVMKEWDGKGLECWDVGLLDMDVNPSEWACWSELVLKEDELQYSSSTSDLLSTEEELMQIIQSEEPVMKLDESGHNNWQSLSGSEVVNCDSNVNIEYSVDSDGLIPCSSDSEEYKGLRLVHLLTACAEAISDGTHDLVEIILCRLKEMVSPTGSTMERVAYYLFQSLQQSHHNSLTCNHAHGMSRRYSCIDESSYIPAFSLLNQIYPYIKIAHFTATQSFLEAIPAQTKRVHIIDFDIMEGSQWPPLMEALKSENYRIGHLKITAIKWKDEEEEEDEDDEDISDPSSSWCKHTGRRLSEYASSLGIPFSFQETKLEDVGTIKRADDEEIVMVNCMWELPHMCERTKKDVVKFINGTRHLNPEVLSLGSGPRGVENPEKLNFTERFSQCLSNLCAMFDSSEAGLPDQFGLARCVVERLFLGPTMCRPINSISDNNDGDFFQFMDIPLQCGFAEHEISCKNLMCAKYLVSNTNAARLYTVERVGEHELLLKWNSTSLAFVSTWRAV